MSSAGAHAGQGPQAIHSAQHCNVCCALDCMRLERQSGNECMLASRLVPWVSAHRELPFCDK